MTWHDAVPGGLPPGRPVLLSAQLPLVPEPRSVGVARSWVAGRLPDWPDAELRDAVLLLTSELVTNGVLHARTQLKVGIATTDHDVLVGVHDLDLGEHPPIDDDRNGGRGLTLVRKVASDCGRVQHPGGGKTIWFRMSR